MLVGSTLSARDGASFRKLSEWWILPSGGFTQTIFFYFELFAGTCREESNKPQTPFRRLTRAQTIFFNKPMHSKLDAQAHTRSEHETDRYAGAPAPNS